MLIFLEGASRSPENCLADPSLRTTGVETLLFFTATEQDIGFEIV